MGQEAEGKSGNIISRDRKRTQFLWFKTDSNMQQNIYVLHIGLFRHLNVTAFTRLIQGVCASRVVCPLTITDSNQQA
jgi:hypothetical protein